MKKLKPFDLNLAKQGKAVCTRDGRKARIICFDRKDEVNQSRNIVALIEGKDGETALCYNDDGRWVKGNEFPTDLFMMPEKEEIWVNLYWDEGRDIVWGTVCGSEEAAQANAKELGVRYLRTEKLEVEE